MASRVPYSPIVDVRPQLTPTRPLFINTPIAAFGGATAAATSLLGRTLDQAGGELATRAMAMQQLNNESTARATAVDFSGAASQLWANFRTQQGANAGPEAYKAYQDSLHSLLGQYRSKLDNPQAQNMYDQQSYSILERLNLYGATHSGEQLDNYQRTTARATAEAAADLTQKNPFDWGAYNSALEKSDSAADNNFRGQSPADVAQQKAIARSQITVGRLRALADTDPAAADKLYNDPRIQENLRGEDMGKIHNYIRSELNRNSGHTISQGLFDGSSMQMGTGPVPIDRAADAIGQIESSGNYEITNKKSGALGKYQVMPSNLKSWLADSGLPQMTSQEFLKDHNAQDQVFNTVFGRYMQETGNFNDATSMWFTGRSMKLAGPNVSDGNNTNASYIAKANAALAHGASRQELVAAARSHAQTLAPDDPDLPDIAANATEARYNQIQRDAKNNSVQIENTIDQAMINQMGQGPMSLDVLMQNPDFAGAYRSLQPKDQLRVQAKLLTMSRHDNTETQDRTNNFQRLQGLAYIDQGSFKETSLTDTDLTADQRKILQGLKDKSIKGELGQDPLLSSALRDGNITDMMRDVLPQTNNGAVDRNSDDYRQFVGAMREEIEAYRAQGKTPSPDELEAKAKDLLSKQNGTGWFGGNWGAAYKYQTPLHLIPPKQQEAIRNAFRDAGRPTPSDSEIEFVWAKHMYNEVNKVKTNGR